jgi:hypothetical protein
MDDDVPRMMTLIEKDRFPHDAAWHTSQSNAI